jgi:4-diphosphocytidyl-2-C-methyl-D-erythritol kinase
LDSLVVFTRTLGDTLSGEVARDGSLTLDVSGPFGDSLEQSDENLVLRAATALRAHCGVSLGAKLHLTKNLPVASGIGGGSADCAAALLGLNQLWDLGLDTETLLQIGATLGADVPACVLGQSLHMTGTGEAITPLSQRACAALTGLGVLLVNPLKPCPTAQVFGHFAQLGSEREATQSHRIKTLSSPEGHEGTKAETHLVHDMTTIKPPHFATRQELLVHLKSHPNHLQSSASALVPDIGTILTMVSRTPEVLLARLSGSGATCFGLYPDAEAARLAAQTLATWPEMAHMWIAADEIG